MKTLLLTAFEPFGGDARNASLEVLRALPDAVGSFRLHKRVLPVEFGTAARMAEAEARACDARTVLCLGQAEGRPSLSVEAVGLNLRDARIPDNAGALPKDTPVIPGGPAAYFSTLPVKALVEAVKGASVPVSLSYSAGVYVCNDLLYSLLHAFRDTDVQAGFIHVPCLTTQAKPGVPCLPPETVVRGVSAAIGALES